MTTYKDQLIDELNERTEPAPQEIQNCSVTDNMRNDAGAAPLPDDVADLVARLRDAWPLSIGLYAEAADMIERLERERDTAMDERIAAGKRIDELERDEDLHIAYMIGYERGKDYARINSAPKTVGKEHQEDSNEAKEPEE